MKMRIKWPKRGLGGRPFDREPIWDENPHVYSQTHTYSLIYPFTYLPKPNWLFFPNASQMYELFCLFVGVLSKAGAIHFGPPPLWFLAADDRLTKWYCSEDRWKEKQPALKLIWCFRQKGGKTYLKLCPPFFSSWQQMKDYSMIDLIHPSVIKLRKFSSSGEGRGKKLIHETFIGKLGY